MTRLDLVGIRLNQFEMFEEHENCLSIPIYSSIFLDLWSPFNHRWLLLGNYPVFTVEMAIYHL